MAAHHAAPLLAPLLPFVVTSALLVGRASQSLVVSRRITSERCVSFPYFPAGKLRHVYLVDDLEADSQNCTDV